MAIQNKSLLMSGKGKKNSTIITIIEDSDFWTRLEIFHQIMRPYDCMTKLFESDNMTLAQIMTSWAWLAGILENLPPALSEVKIFLYNKLNNRWQKIYDPAFIVSWALHPSNDPNYLTYGITLDIQEMAYQLFKKIYPNYNVNAFLEGWLAYRNRTGIFNKQSLWTPIFINNPMKFWQSIEEIYPELSVFAQRLFAITPNAAASERIWSVLSNIHTAKRNRLTAERSGKLAKISWHLKQEHLKQEQNEKIMKSQEIIIQEEIELDGYNFDNLELSDIAEEILKETNDLLGEIQDITDEADNNNEEFIDILTISEIFNIKKFEESGRNIDLL